MPAVPISTVSSACLHPFALFVFTESPLGLLCLYNAEPGEILSYRKGVPKHDNRNANKFHISESEVLISKITAL